MDTHTATSYEGKVQRLEWGCNGGGAPLEPSKGVFGVKTKRPGNEVKEKYIRKAKNSQFEGLKRVFDTLLVEKRKNLKL